MTRQRLFMGIGGAAVLAAGLVAVAWATGLIFAGPSHSAWAAEVCDASDLDPTQNQSWRAMRDDYDDAILLLGETELPGGTEEFHAALIESMRVVRAQLNGFARADPGGGLLQMLEDLDEIAQSRPRGPSADTTLSVFYTSIRESEALIHNAADSLPDRSRDAIQDVPGCAERLLG